MTADKKPTKAKRKPAQRGLTKKPILGNIKPRISTPPLKTGSRIAEVAELADKIGSNWITTEKFLSELIQEKKVIEIISASKSKVYANITDLAFFYLPLSDDVRNKTLGLLSTISVSYKEKTGKFLLD
jgi:DNA-binding transcriptional regulator YhcF (GntR family)